MTTGLAQITPAPRSDTPPPQFGGSTGSATGDAAAAFAAGDLARADLLYRAAYQMGDHGPATVAARAQLALWQNKLIEAENLAKAIDTQAPEAKIADEVIKTIALRRGDESLEVHYMVPGAAVTIPLLQRDPLPLLVATINRRAAALIIGTATDQLCIDENFAKQLSLVTTGAGRRETGDRKSGEAFAKGIVDRVELGNMRVSKVPVTVLPARRFASLGMPVDGIIGTRFLAQFRATIDYPRSQLVLAPRNLAWQPPSSATVVPLWLVGEHDLYVQAAVGNGEPRMWLIDTGRQGSGVVMWDRAYLEQTGISLNADVARPGGGRGGKLGSLGFTLPELRLGNGEARDLPAELIKASPVVGAAPFNIGGLLSHQFFEQWSLTLDLEKMQLVLEKPAK